MRVQVVLGKMAVRLVSSTGVIALGGWTGLNDVGIKANPCKGEVQRLRCATAAAPADALADELALIADVGGNLAEGVLVDERIQPVVGRVEFAATNGIVVAQIKDARADLRQRLLQRGTVGG